MDTTTPSQAEVPHSLRDKTKTFWSSYARLIGYALRHKGKLAILISASFLTAVSMGTMIVTVTSGIDIIYTDEIEIEAKIAEYQAYATPLADRIAKVTGERPDLEGWIETLLISIREDRATGLRLIALLIISITLIGAVSRYIQEYLAGIISAEVVTRLRNEMYNSIIQLSHEFYDRQTTGEIAARFTNDVTMVNIGLLDVFVLVFREPIKIATLLAIAFSTSPKIAMFIVFFLLPFIMLFLVTARRVKKRVQKQLHRVSSVSSILMETLRGITVVKSFRMEDSERSRMSNELNDLRHQMTRLARIDAAISPLTEVFLMCGAGALIIVGDQLVIAEGLGPAGLIALAVCMIGTVDPMRKVARVNNRIQISAVSASRVFEYVDAKPTIQEAEDATDLGEIQQSIDFDNVSFSYDGKTPILKDMSFSVKKGEMVAIVGFSGAGKSTVAKLIPRFYDANSGTIRIDGTDIKTVTFNSLRKQIGFVTQDNILFNRSVRDNLTFGRDDFDDEHLRSAAKVAQADTFVEDMTKGYDSMVSEAGANLSGGQRQRLAIARAIMKDPAIMILDEATSSLDTESESAIQEAIDKFAVGRTTIVIAHRLSTIQRADRIIVMSHGEVAEQGTHHELLQQDGIYSRLHHLQFAEMPDPDDEIA